MPGTADRAVLDHALDERTAVVRARRADREVLVADAGDQHRIAERVAEQLVARLQVARRDAGGQIRTRQLRIAAHASLRSLVCLRPDGACSRATGSEEQRIPEKAPAVPYGAQPELMDPDEA